LRPEKNVHIISETTYREADHVFSAELKKGSSEMLILALLEARPRHGYEIGKLIEARSGGKLTFALPTLYPTLLRLENRGWIKGRWVEKPGERRRCFYRLTAEGRRILAEQQKTWEDFIGAVKAVMGTSHA
jgi:PadR family transcriptional regulator, regulatory protein PadR